MEPRGLSALARTTGIKAFGLVGVVPIVGLVAACGGGSPAHPAGLHKPATPAATPAVASPSPTPEPAQPVVMVSQSGANSQNVLQAMDTSGNPLWSVPYAQLSGPGMFAAGPRIFETDTKAMTVSVFDRAGHPVGSGTLNASLGAVVFNPAAPEWAWSTEDGVSPSPAPTATPVTVNGSFWVAGVGEAPHRVYRWTESDQAGTFYPAADMLVEWSDQGLVSSMFAPWTGCAEGHQTSSFVVDPATGARTDLGSAPVVDVHAGVIVSAPRPAIQAPQTVVLSGRTSFTWAEPLPGKEDPEGVFISPDGSHVAVALFNLGCAGEQPQLRTALINVSDHSVQYLPNAFARGWLDDTHLIAQVTWDSPNQELDVVGLDGAHTLLGHGRLIGVLTSS